MKKNIKQEISFEQQLSRLDEIVDILDAGEKPMDELLVLYEEGINIAKSCREYLEKAEQKIEQLSVKNDVSED